MAGANIAGFLKVANAMLDSFLLGWVKLLQIFKAVLRLLSCQCFEETLDLLSTGVRIKKNL